MTTEEIEKAAKIYEKEFQKHPLSSDALREDFSKFGQIINKHWQEKTRWKSLEKEPPTNYTYGKMYLLRTESGSPYLVPLPYKESAKEFINCGFIEWKEIE